MEHKVFDEKSYKIYTIKTDRFKTSTIKVVFRTKVDKITMPRYSFLASYLNKCTKNYKSPREVALKKEELYNAYAASSVDKIGDCLKISFVMEFINQKYIEEKDYLHNIVSFLFEMILKPNIKNGSFDLNIFNMVKDEILLDIESINENPGRKAINNAITNMDKDSSSAFSVIGTKEDIENITEEKLYETYLNLVNNSLVDIFVIGDLDENSVVREIEKVYKNHHIRHEKIDYYIENKTRNKLNVIEEESPFLQTQLVALYNLINLEKIEKELTFHVLNFILGSGGLSSKLNRYVREDNGYCYHISSMYFKYDNVMCIASSLQRQNVEHTLKLIKKAIKEMQNGDFTEEEVEDAKQNLLLSLKIGKNKKQSILSNFEFSLYTGAMSIEDKIENIKNITKKDIVKLAKKIKENTVYILSEEKDERNNN